ncbi:MAG: hypothetical protein ACRDRI_05350 [Pseudonocardiaceae bacterium]
MNADRREDELPGVDLAEPNHEMRWSSASRDARMRSLVPDKASVRISAVSQSEVVYEASMQKRIVSTGNLPREGYRLFEYLAITKRLLNLDGIELCGIRVAR